MANQTFTITFRIADDASYDDRYDSLVEEIEKIGLYWKRTTSFYAVRSAKTTKDIGSSLYLSSKISAATDDLLVVNSHNNEAYYIGPQRPDSFYFNFVND